jgi:RPA family protein
MAIERQNLRKSRISDIVDARFFAGSLEESKPNSVVTKFGDVVSRVQLVGTVVEKFRDEGGRFGSVTVDDGTESVRARVFGEDMKYLDSVNVGDVVAVVGRMKNYNNENYISPDFVRRTDDPNAETLFRLEVLQGLAEKKKTVDDIRRLRDEMSQDELKDYASEKYGMGEEVLRAVLEGKTAETDYKPVVLDAIGKLDSGGGVEIGKLLESVKLEESMVESAISELLSSGEIYEPAAGKFRRVG